MIKRSAPSLPVGSLAGVNSYVSAEGPFLGKPLTTVVAFVGLFLRVSSLVPSKSLSIEEGLPALCAGMWPLLLMGTANMLSQGSLFLECLSTLVTVKRRCIAVLFTM